jgi:branched-chain amino acid aminotransferase
VLWLFGESHEITEVGAMNLFIFLEHANGRRELVTPPLDMGMILAGVTRRSIIEMVSKWGEFEVNERPITMPEVVAANAEGRLLEVFGAGTAAVVSPVGGIFYEGRMHDLPVPEKSLSSRSDEPFVEVVYRS